MHKEALQNRDENFFITTDASKYVETDDLIIHNELSLMLDNELSNSIYNKVQKMIQNRNITLKLSYILDQNNTICNCFRKKWKGTKLDNNGRTIRINTVPNNIP